MVFKSVQVVIITLLLKNLRASHSSVASGNFFEDVHIAGPTYASSSGLTPTIHFHKCTREKECNYLILNVKNGTLQHMTKLPAAFPSKADEELKVWRKITEGPCPLRYSSVGCFDNHNGGSLKLLVSNERDTSSIKWNRHLIDWAIFEDLLPGIVCRCLMTAASHGSTIAGVMNYGGFVLKSSPGAHPLNKGFRFPQQKYFIV